MPAPSAKQTRLQDEIQQCIARRAGLLRSLYLATDAYLGAGPPESGGDAPPKPLAENLELGAFLQANDVEQNRPFDISTLPQTRSRKPCLSSVSTRAIAEQYRRLHPSTKPQVAIVKDAADPSPVSEKTSSEAVLPKVRSEPTEPVKDDAAEPTPSEQSADRRVTRVSSGTLPHKSVSEILGESSRVSSDDLVRKHSLAEKSCSVVFSKPSGPPKLDSHQPKDYFLTYFTAQTCTSPRAAPLSTLLRSAHKTLTTADHYTEFQEKQDYRILSKIMDMQSSGHWSMRQPQRSIEVQRSVTHWDILLGEMKWMRTDFREERKLKIAAAKMLATACAHWVNASPAARRELQVSHKAKTQPAAAVFNLPDDVFVFEMEQTPSKIQLLEQLPFHDPAGFKTDAKSRDPDGAWRSACVPMSKFVQGKFVGKTDEPARKRPRLDPELEEHSEDSALPPKVNDVALFNPDSRMIKDRIYAGHAFKPPAEHPMPSQDFFEHRHPSQWTLGEEDELRKLVREYSYNWSLISSCLSSESNFSSGPERRTPWECFERWIQLEGLPAEMTKVPYFREYNLRLQEAQKVVEARQQTHSQQESEQATSSQPAFRRRSTQPYSVDRRRDFKHIHLLDAMRKQAKKREAAVQKQQHVAGLSAMRKAAEPNKVKQQIPTPRAFSRLKYDQQQKKAETERAFRLQMAQQQNLRRLQGPNQGTPGALVNGGPSTSAAHQQPLQAQNQTANGARPPNLSSPGIRSGTPTAGLASVKAAPTSHALPNGTSPRTAFAQVAGLKMPRSQAQFTPDLRVVSEAQRLQLEQQSFLQAQRQQSNTPNNNLSIPRPTSSSSLHANGISDPGRQSPALNHAGLSPRSTHLTSSASVTSLPAGLSQIQNQLKARHINATPAEIQRLTSEHLYRLSQQSLLQQSALSKGARPKSSSSPSPMPVGVPHPGNTVNQAQYAQFMRSQQATQQKVPQASNNGVSATSNAINLGQRKTDDSPRTMKS